MTRRSARGLLDRLLAALREMRASFVGRDPEEGDPEPPKAPRRDVWAPQAPIIVASTVLVDLLMIIFSYAIARAVWPWHRIPDIGELARVSPVILATIPCWLVVFQLFGLYSRKQVLEPSLRLTKLLEAISVSIFAVIVVAFASNDDKLHRAWVLTVWVVATVLIVSGRIATLRLAHLLNEDHRLGPPTF